MRQAILMILLALACLPVQAELHVVSRVTVDDGEPFRVEQWIDSHRGTREVGDQAYIADLRKRQVLVVDHRQRTVTEFELVDPKDFGAFEYEIESTGRYDTIGKWEVEEFHATVPDQPGVDYYVWATRDIRKANTQLYFNFIRSLPSGDALSAMLKELYGFPVRIVTVVEQDDGSVQRTDSTVISIDNDAAPAGTYEAPKGYVLQ